MLSKDDLAKRMAATDDARKLLVAPRWMLDHVERPATDLSSLPQDQLNDRVLAKVTNNRLPIHLGPLLYLFKRRSEFEKYAWHTSNTDEFIIDLTKLTDGYPLQSGETVVAASAEYFEFPDDLAGFVISRVGNHLSGIDVSTTFIDAGWPGIITFQITNVDSHPRVLKLGLEIARLFVFELSSPQQDAQRHARDESHHAGISWKKVLNGNRSPFEKVTTPARLLAGPTSEQPQARHFIPKALRDYYDALCKKLGVPAEVPGLLAFTIVAAITVWTYRQPIADTATAAGKVTETWKSVASLVALAPERKVVRVAIRKGVAMASTRLTLNEARIKKGAIPMAMARATGFPQELGVKTVEALIGNDNRELELTIRLLKVVSSDTDIDIEYVIFWRENDGGP